MTEDGMSPTSWDTSWDTRVSGIGCDSADVLVVDDAHICRLGAKLAFSRLGFTVATADDGEAAVNMVRNGGVYQLVLMDRNMPNKEGPEAAAELLELSAKSGDIPLLVGVTADTSDEGRDAFLRAGACEVIHKPLTPHIIQALLLRLGLSVIPRSSDWG
eukprot:GHVR01005681.1.p1 GENE.GHVR01005681.1~~GHVR01005681.1.p1  ORF type:complete len:177 (-),score=70.63 GHVR01005681.1:196-672(-)